jgi:alpha-tubulin suppressor-like RCC1 family protein
MVVPSLQRGVEEIAMDLWLVFRFVGWSRSRRRRGLTVVLLGISLACLLGASAAAAKPPLPAAIPGTASTHSTPSGARVAPGTPLASQASRLARYRGLTRHPSALGAAKLTAASISGSSVAWGQDSYGQIGDGGDNASVPNPVSVQLPGGVSLRQVSAGDYHSLGVALDGSVYAWGTGSQGQLGNGGTSPASTPVAVSLPAGVTAKQVAAGGYFSVALTSTGKVYAWGDDSSGELGNGTTINAPTSTPVAVSLPSGVSVTQIAAGEAFALALTSTGQVYAWGDNSAQELGDPAVTETTSDTPVPVSLPPSTTITQVSAGSYFAQALTSAGGLLAWGAGAAGTLGNGSSANSSTPVAVSLPQGTNVDQVSAGHTFALALTSTGSVLAWGAGSKGQLGNGSPSGSQTPAAVSLPTGTRISQVAAGGSFAVALTSAGQAYSWGDDVWGELGNGRAGGQSTTPVPVAVPTGVSLTSASAGLDHVLAVLGPDVASVSPGFGPAYGGTSVTITGSGFNGITGVNFGSRAAKSFSVQSSTSITATAPAGSGAVNVVVKGSVGGSALVAADRFTYLAGSAALAWGLGSDGELGNGTSASVSTPVLPSLPSQTKVIALSGETYTSLALTSTGQVYEWGAAAGRNTPKLVPFPSGTTITAVAGEGSSALALTASGQVYAWGDNAYGQLGNASTTSSSAPVPVSLPSGAKATAIAGQSFGGLALLSTGRVLAWGDNDHGQLGNGTTDNSDVPVPVSVPSGTTVVSIAGEGYGALAMTSAGQLLAWGYNQDGELGNGTTTSGSVPVTVSLPQGTSVKAIAGEGYDGLALTSTGKVLAWGFNGDGELGDGNTTNSSIPVAVSLPAGTTVTGLGSELLGGLATTQAGTVLAWGFNGDGELGDGSTAISTSVPVAAALPAGVVATALTQGLGFTGLAEAGTPPVITGVAPAIGSAAGGAGVTITGSGLTGASAVRFGSQPAASFSVTSSTSITAVPPAGSGTVDVTVTGPGGTSPVAAADQFTYVTSGQVIAWGSNFSGELGTGSTAAYSTVPAASALPAGTRVQAVASGSDDSYALTSSGKLYAWGDNSYGELGNGSNAARSSTPVLVSLPAGVKAIAVGAGFATAYAVTSGGQVYAWGYGPDGELGNGTTSASTSTPVRVSLPTGVKATAVAGEYYGGLALTSSGGVYAWGYGADGELGNGTTTFDSPTPVKVALPSGVTATAVAGQSLSGMALTSGGQVYDWGYNPSGNLGDGSSAVNNPTPVLVHLPGITVTAIAGEFYSGLALTSTGRVYAWGEGANGQLGNGKTTNSSLPVTVSLPSGTAVTALGSAGNSSLALTSSGHVLAWGSNTTGELGNGTTNDNLRPVAVKIPAGIEATALSQGLDSTPLAVVGLPPAVGSSALYVSDSSANRITSYAANASGNAAPVTTIAGASTHLASPAGILVTPAGTVDVANSASSSITEYAPGANGDLAPLVTIAGSATGLSGPQGIAMNASGDLFVANATANSITEYGPGANGNAAPIATIAGAATGLSSPQGITVDSLGNLVVANRGANIITEYALGARGNAAPTIKLSGSATRLSQPVGVLFDSSGHLRVSNQGANAIDTFSASATGNTAPLASLSGTATALSGPGGMDVNGSGDIAVANHTSNAITLFGPNATANAAPSTTISGSATGLSAPSYAAFTPPPVAITGKASRLRRHAVLVSGHVNPAGSRTRWFFQYRHRGAEHWESTAAASAGRGGTPIRVRAAIGNLAFRGAYQYRLVATNPGGTDIGATRTFSNREA